MQYGRTGALTGPPPTNIDFKNDAFGGSASNALLSAGLGSYEFVDIGMGQGALLGVTVVSQLFSLDFSEVTRVRLRESAELRAGGRSSAEHPHG